MLEPYDGKLSRTVLRREGGGNTADPADYYPLVERLKGQVIKVSQNSTQYINPMDINLNYSEGDTPIALKSDFILSFCELIMGGKNGLEAVEKTLIDRAVISVYRSYLADPKPENMPILGDLYDEIKKQPEKEAQRIAAALELYVNGSLNIFNHRTNVDIHNRLVCFDIKELGTQLKKVGMLIVQDQVWNRVTVNRSEGKATRYYIDEFHLLLKEEQTAAYSVEIWKRFRKWGGIPTIMWLIMKAIRFLGDDSQKNWKSRLYFGMKGLIAALVSYYTLLITYAKTLELLHKSENKLQNVSSIEWFKSVLQLLPIIMTILLFINIIHVVKAIEDHKEEQQMMTVARLAGVAKVTAVVTVISDFILNFYQFLLGATLQNVNVTFAPDVSMEPLIIAFGALIFHEYFKRTKQLKEENDQFI